MNSPSNLNGNSNPAVAQRPAGSDAFNDAVTGPGIGQYLTASSGGGNAIGELWHAVLRRRWLVGAIFAMFMLAAIVITLLTTPVYRATTTMEILAEEVRIVDSAAADSASVAMTRPEYLETQYGLLRSTSLAARVATDLNLGAVEGYGILDGATAGSPEAAIARAAAQLRANVEVEPIEGSRLVNIHYYDTDPALAVRIANAYARAFVAANLDRKTGTTDITRDILADRLEEAKQRLADSEQVLASYARQAGIVNVGGSEEGGNTGSSSLDAASLTQLNAALAQAVQDRIAAEQQARFAEAGSSGTLNNALISTLLARQSELTAEYNRKSQMFRDSYPEMQQLRRQIEDIESSILQERGRVRTGRSADLQAARAQEEQLRSQVDALRSNLLDLNDRSVRYNILEREVETNRQFYDALLQRFSEVDVEQNIGAANVAVVDEASSPDKVRPDVLFNLLLGALLGLVAGMLGALGLEFLDDSIKASEDITGRLGLSLLGIVPRTNDNPVEAASDAKSELAEAYFSARTAIDLATATGAPRSMLITSSRPAEGKSITSFALANAFARAGRNVLLVDADMRKPTIDVGEQAKVGFSTLLAGSDDFDSAIRKDVADRMAVLPSGPVPPNPGELLSGNRVKALLDELGEHYDIVILDGPPVMGLADAPLLAAVVGGTVFVIEAGGRRSMVATALNRMRASGANVLGSILTQVEQGFAGYGYGYGTGYGYGYGYGKEQRSEDSRIRLFRKS